jgi:hypothetical protein
MTITAVGLDESFGEKVGRYPGRKAFFQLAKSKGAEVFDRLSGA